MKRILYICSLLGALAHLLWWATAQAAVTPPLATVEELNAIVAVVNTHVITLAELRDALQLKLGMMKKHHNPANLNMTFIVPAVLQNLITETLQKQAADARHISVSDEQFQQVLRTIATHNQLSSVEALKHKIRQDGLDDRAVLEDIRTQVLLTNLREFMMQTSIYIPRSDSIEYINTQRTMHHTRYLIDQIFVPVDQKTASKEEQRAARVHTQAIYDALLNKKKTFAAEKKENTTSTSPAQWLMGDSLPEALRSILQNIAPGHFSPPLRLVDGYHILFLIRREELPNPFGDIQQWHAIAWSVPIQHPHAQTIAQEIYRDSPHTTTAFLQWMQQHRIQHPYPPTDLDWLCAYNIPDTSMLAVLQKQPLRTVSPPFLSSMGWTIVAILEQRTAPLSQSQQIILAQKTLQQAQFDDTYRRFLQSLRDQAYIHIYRYAPSGTPK